MSRVYLEFYLLGLFAWVYLLVLCSNLLLFEFIVVRIELFCTRIVLHTNVYFAHATNCFTPLNCFAHASNECYTSCESCCYQ